MTRRPPTSTWIVAAIALLAAVGLIDRSTPEPRAILLEAATPLAAVSTVSRPVSDDRPAPLVVASFHAAPPDATPAPVRPRRGVRGRIVSPNVIIRHGPDGAPVFGLSSCEILPFRAVEDQKARFTTFVFSGSKDRAVTPSAEGDFEIDLAPGIYRISAQHDPRHATTPWLREFWYAIVRIDAADQGLLDLGENRFAPAPVTGTIVDLRMPGTLDLSGTNVEFSDAQSEEPGLPLSATGYGVDVKPTSSGEFAVSLARYSGSNALIPHPGRVCGCITATLGGDTASLEPVTMGEHVEVKLTSAPRRAEVPTTELTLTFRNVPATAHAWLIGDRLVTAKDFGSSKKNKDGSFRTTFVLERGRWSLEVSDATTNRWFGREIVVDAPGQSIEIDPDWRDARTVTSATGEAMTRVMVRGGREIPLQRSDATASGACSVLRGLPPHGDVVLRVGDELFRVDETRGQSPLLDAACPRIGR